MENDNFLRTLCNIVFDKNQLKRLHNDVTNHYLKLLERVGAAAGPLGPATGEFGAAVGPLGPATGEFRAAVGPLGPATGEFGAAVRPLGPATGEFGAAVRPLGPATGEFGAAVGPLGPATGEFGAAAGPLGPTTDNTDWNKQVNIFKIRLKLLSMLYEYQNNLDGADAVSFNTIKIVNDDGKLINVRHNQQSADDGVESNQPYSCPNCQTNIFKRIHKRTKDGHEDKRILLETINIVEELINDVSQATSAQISSNILAKLIYTNDEQKHPLIEKQTRLICQGELKNNRGQKLHVFLFDEIILFTRIATRNGVKSYQLTNSPIPLGLLRIEDIEDGVKIPELSSGSFSRTLAGSKPARNVFRCSSLDTSHRNISILLQARDIYDKQQWLSAFRSIMIMQ